jgi:hypothetical protein
VATTTAEGHHIYKALVAVAGELAKIGVAKDRVNDQQHFAFRGIDDVCNAVSPLLAKHEIVFQVRYMDHPDTERATREGRSMILTKVKGEFTFIAAVDGSSMSVTTFGVAMDSSDKAMNKAMSASLKYALLQTFLIPTESTEDADATTQEDTVPAPPAGFQEWFNGFLLASNSGLTSMRNVWRTGQDAWRTYATEYCKTERAAAKAQAEAVDERDAVEAP